MKKYLVYVMGTVYALAGINHFIMPEVYTRIMPPIFPAALMLVYVSGVAEILLGIGLCIKATRKIAAWGLIALLIAIYPVHFYMALHPDIFNNVPLAGLYLRIPLQLLFIYWACVYT
jgi:uncharacterized membrane protein